MVITRRRIRIIAWARITNLPREIIMTFAFVIRGIRGHAFISSYDVTAAIGAWVKGGAKSAEVGGGAGAGPVICGKMESYMYFLDYYMICTFIHQKFCL